MPCTYLPATRSGSLCAGSNASAPCYCSGAAEKERAVPQSAQVSNLPFRSSSKSQHEFSTSCTLVFCEKGLTRVFWSVQYVMKFTPDCRLVEEYPDRAVSWFGVACYYLCIGRYENARRYFGKATTVDASFAPAWLGFGHAFAAQDESDQVTRIYTPFGHHMDHRGYIHWQAVAWRFTPCQAPTDRLLLRGTRLL